MDALSSQRPQEADEVNLSRLLGATMVAGALGPAAASAAPAGATHVAASTRAASASKARVNHVPDSQSGSGAVAGFAMPPAGAAGQ
jgi:hypothetical protein